VAVDVGLATKVGTDLMRITTSLRSSTMILEAIRNVDFAGYEWKVALRKLLVKTYDPVNLGEKIDQ